MRIGFFVLLAVGLALQISVASRAVWFDELTTLYNTESVAKSLQKYRGDFHLPLYFVVLALYRSVMPSTDFSLRLLSVLGGLVSLTGVYFLGRTIREGVGRIALLIALLSPFHLVFSTELRPYTLSLAFSAVATWAYFEMIRKGGRRYAILFLISTLLNLWTHFFALFLLLVQTILFLIPAGKAPEEDYLAGRGWKSRILFGAGAIVVVLIAYAPWAGSMAGMVQSSVVLQETMVAGRWKGGGLGASDLFRYVQFQLGGSPGLVLPQLLFLGISLWVYRRRRLTPALLLLWLIPFGLLLLLQPAHFVRPKYFCFTFPLTAAMIAAGACHVAGFVRQRYRRGFVFAPVFAFLIPVLSLLPGFHPPYYFHRSDWKTVSERFASSVQSGDTVCFLDVKSETMLRHYLPASVFRGIRRIAWTSDRSIAALHDSAKEGRVWLLTRRRLPEELVQRAGGDLQMVHEWEIYPAEITLYVWRAPS